MESAGGGWGTVLEHGEHWGPDGPLGGFRPSDRPRWGRAPEDWSPVYATGRATWATLVPTLAGSGLLSAAGPDAEAGDPRVRAAFLTTAVGWALGPSAGEWCLGADARRRSLLPTALRIAGIGQMVWASHALADRMDGEGLGGLSLGVLLPVVIAPGFAALLIGTRWSWRNTPRVRCGTRGRKHAVHFAPAVDLPTGGHGVQVRVVF